MRPREAVAAILVVILVAIALAVAALSVRLPVTTTTATKTVVYTLPNGANSVVKEIIIQPELVNDVCVLWHQNVTSTIYLTPVTTYTAPGSSSKQTTTETLEAVSTITIYNNATYADSTTTCVDVNPHYGVTTSCPPCV